MRRFVLGWKTLGHETRYQARIVNYADDFVILCRRRADDALAAMRDMMRAAEVDGQRNENARLSPACRIVRFPWVYVRSDVFTANGRGLSRRATARKKVLGVCHRLNELVGKLPTFIRPEALVYQVNQVLRGWANYFCYGTYTPAFHDRAYARLSSGPSVATAEIRGRVGRDTANIPTAIWSVSLDC